ncbi:hypothetical protein DLK00_09270 [Haemophilus influenzae]|nr:hypothetical protein DLK00_09270 [Haemophilus influenzae]
MSASIKVKVSRSLKGKSFQKLSNNAKQNQRLNSGVTAANAFYLLWDIDNEKRNSRNNIFFFSVGNHDFWWFY